MTKENGMYEQYSKLRGTVSDEVILTIIKNDIDTAKVMIDGMEIVQSKIEYDIALEKLYAASEGELGDMPIDDAHLEILAGDLVKMMKDAINGIPTFITELVSQYHESTVAIEKDKNFQKVADYKNFINCYVRKEEPEKSKTNRWLQGESEK